MIPLLIAGVRVRRPGARTAAACGSPTPRCWTSVVPEAVPVATAPRGRAVAAALVTLTAAFAQPSTQIDVPRERATVVIVIDASLVDAGHRRGPEPAGRGQGGRDRVRREHPGQVQRGRWSRWPATPSILVPPTTGPQHRRERDQRHPAAGLDRDRGGRSTPRCARCSRPRRTRTIPTRSPRARSCCSRTAPTPPAARPMQAAAAARNAKVPDLHDRVRHRERLRRPRRQA